MLVVLQLLLVAHFGQLHGLSTALECLLSLPQLQLHLLQSLGGLIHTGVFGLLELLDLLG